MLTRIKVVPSRNGVKLMGFAPAAKGNERLVGFVECKLADIAQVLKSPDVQHIIGLDQQPKRRVRENS